MAGALVKIAFSMKIEVFSWKGCQIREMRIWCLPGGLKILCNCMQFACNVVRTFQGLNHEFNTPAGGLAAWWRIETWAREGSIALIPPHGDAPPSAWTNACPATPARISPPKQPPQSLPKASPKPPPKRSRKEVKRSAQGCSPLPLRRADLHIPSLRAGIYALP